MTEIAVVIPCYNLGRTVEQAVDSVLAQTRPAAEIVVVDDGSTDLYSRRLLAKLARPRTRVVRTANRGLPAARNHGIGLTSAGYLVALDADDFLAPSYLERTAARLDADPGLAFVSTGMRGFEGADYVWTPPPCDLIVALARGTAHASSMFRRRVWDAVGGFDERFRTCEDLDFWVAAMARGLRGDVIDEPLLHRRVRADSLHHRTVAQGTHYAAVEAVLRKHRATAESLGVELLVAKTAYLREMRDWQRTLVARRGELERERAAVEADIAAAQAALRARGRQPVEWADLRRREPFSSDWGFERGKPIDRHYIEQFLAAYRDDIHGRVLEVQDSAYTRQFGAGRVTESDVLDIDPTNRAATIVADLCGAETIPARGYDCIILTQTLHLIYDMARALTRCARLLRPGGVLLATLPCLSRVDPAAGLDGDCWRLTEASARALFAAAFPPERVEVHAYGNVLAGTAFLYGLSGDDVGAEELGVLDPYFPVLLGVRARAA
jgi:SAM-dependent methyltransferase